MRHFSKHWMVYSVVVLLIALTIPLNAQDPEPGPGEGAPIVVRGGDPLTLNPLFAADDASWGVLSWLHPTFIGIDLVTLSYGTGGNGFAIVTGWEISEDGRTYTFFLRDDWNWSDGTPITAADYLYAYEASVSGEIEPSGNIQTAVRAMEQVTAIDAYTIEIIFLDASCESLAHANAIPVVPAHDYRERFPNFSDMNDADSLDVPVSAGPFTFENYRAGEQITLVANQDFPDAQLGFVVPEGLIIRITDADHITVFEQFRQGEYTFIGVPLSMREEVREAAARGEYQIFESPFSAPRYIFWNLADPENPQSAYDDEGNPLDQGHHPVFGDVRVRQALAMGYNFADFNEGVLFNSGVPMAVPVPPWSWAYNPDLQPRSYDPDRAAALLTEAGWIDEDGDGVRECHGCLYAEDGDLLEFELITNAGHAGNEALGTVLQDEWGRLGVQVVFTPVGFNVLVETILGQTHDAVLIFASNGLPENPDGLLSALTPMSDVVGSGFNTGSYNNPRVTELLDRARVLPGCNEDERRALYWEAMDILHEEIPWLPFGSSLVTVVAHTNVQNWDPTICCFDWNLDAWFVFQPDP